MPHDYQTKDFQNITIVYIPYVLTVSHHTYHLQNYIPFLRSTYRGVTELIVAMSHGDH